MMLSSLSKQLFQQMFCMAESCVENLLTYLWVIAIFE